jgi:hypothetical protein
MRGTNEGKLMNRITKGLLGAAVLLGIAAPIALGATAADAAPVQPTKATGTVGFHYTDQNYNITGTAVFSANDKTGRFASHTDDLGQTINGTGHAHHGRRRSSRACHGHSRASSPAIAPRTPTRASSVVVDGSASGAADQIGLYVQRDRVGDSDIAAVTSGNLTVF